MKNLFFIVLLCFGLVIAEESEKAGDKDPLKAIDNAYKSQQAFVSELIEVEEILLNRYRDNHIVKKTKPTEEQAKEYDQLLKNPQLQLSTMIQKMAEEKGGTEDVLIDYINTGGNCEDKKKDLRNYYCDKFVEKDNWLLKNYPKLEKYSIAKFNYTASMSQYKDAEKALQKIAKEMEKRNQSVTDEIKKQLEYAQQVKNNQEALESHYRLKENLSSTIFENEAADGISFTKAPFTLSLGLHTLPTPLEDLTSVNKTSTIEDSKITEYQIFPLTGKTPGGYNRDQKVLEDKIKQNFKSDIPTLIEEERKRLIRLEEIRNKLAEGDEIANAAYIEFYKKKREPTFRLLLEMGYVDKKTSAEDLNNKREREEQVFPYFKDVDDKVSSLQKSYQEHLSGYYQWRYDKLKDEENPEPTDDEIKLQKQLLKAKIILSYLKNRPAKFKDGNRIKQIEKAITEIKKGDLEVLGEVLKKRMFKKYWDNKKYKKNGNSEEEGKFRDFVNLIDSELNVAVGLTTDSEGNPSTGSKIIDFINERVRFDYLLEEKEELNTELEESIYPTILSVGSLHPDLAKDIYEQRKKESEDTDENIIPSNFELGKRLTDDDFLGDVNKNYINGIQSLERTQSADPLSSVTPLEEDGMLVDGDKVKYFNVGIMDEDGKTVVPQNLSRVVKKDVDGGGVTYEYYTKADANSPWEKQSTLPSDGNLVILDEDGEVLKVEDAKVFVSPELNMNEGTVLPEQNNTSLANDPPGTDNDGDGVIDPTEPLITKPKDNGSSTTVDAYLTEACNLAKDGEKGYLLKSNPTSGPEWNDYFIAVDETTGVIRPYVRENDNWVEATDIGNIADKGIGLFDNPNTSTGGGFKYQPNAWWIEELGLTKVRYGEAQWIEQTPPSEKCVKRRLIPDNYSTVAPGPVKADLSFFDKMCSSLKGEQKGYFVQKKINSKDHLDIFVIIDPAKKERKAFSRTSDGTIHESTTDQELRNHGIRKWGPDSDFDTGKLSFKPVGRWIAAAGKLMTDDDLGKRALIEYTIANDKSCVRVQRIPDNYEPNGTPVGEIQVKSTDPVGSQAILGSTGSSTQSHLSPQVTEPTNADCNDYLKSKRDAINNILKEHSSKLFNNRLQLLDVKIAKHLYDQSYIDYESKRKNRFLERWAKNLEGEIKGSELADLEKQIEEYSQDYINRDRIQEAFKSLKNKLENSSNLFGKLENDEIGVLMIIENNESKNSKPFNQSDINLAFFQHDLVSQADGKGGNWVKPLGGISRRVTRLIGGVKSRTNERYSGNNLNAAALEELRKEFQQVSDAFNAEVIAAFEAKLDEINKKCDRTCDNKFLEQNLLDLIQTVNESTSKIYFENRSLKINNNEIQLEIPWENYWPQEDE